MEEKSFQEFLLLLTVILYFPWQAFSSEKSQEMVEFLYIKERKNAQLSTARMYSQTAITRSVMFSSSWPFFVQADVWGSEERKKNTGTKKKKKERAVTDITEIKSSVMGFYKKL